MSPSNSEPKLTNAQRCTIRVLRSLDQHINGPVALYPGSEHAEAVIVWLHESGPQRREFLIAPGGCASEILR